jgi:flavin-dependent dehydrogenase
MVYDKELLLGNLRDEMNRERVALFEGTELTDIALEGNDVVVQAGGKAFRSTYVIAADGTNSRVVEKLGFNQERKHIGTLYAQSFFIRGFTPPYGNATIAGFTFTEQGPAFMFLFPRPDGDTWNVIFLALEKKVDLTKVGHHFMQGSRYASWFKHAETLRSFSALEYIYSPILKPFKNNVLVIGDAASCQELENSGAMITGWKGGQAIAAALKERELGVATEAITRYFDWWINTYIKNYDYEDYVKCFTIPYIFVTPEIMDYVFGLIKEPMPPCFNPYSAVRLLGQTMQGILPRIIADRPDILKHLMKMGASASEILAHTLKD